MKAAFVYFDRMFVWLICNKTVGTNANCFNHTSHICAQVKIEHKGFTSLLGENASRRLHATPLTACRHSSSLRDNIFSTGHHTSTSTMGVPSSLVERERLWKHLEARRREWFEQERGTVSSHYPPIIYLFYLFSLPRALLLPQVYLFYHSKQSRPSLLTLFTIICMCHTDFATCILI